MVESMPMSRVAQQERSKVTRRRLLEASLDTLSDVGLAGTTVSAVAARAGVSRGAAQHHFPTRDSLVEAALEEFFAERTQQLRSSVAKLSTGSGAAAVDAVDEVVTLIFGFFSNRPFHAALHIWAAASTDDSLRELIVPAEARYGREVYQLTALALNADLSTSTPVGCWDSRWTSPVDWASALSSSTPGSTRTTPSRPGHGSSTASSATTDHDPTTPQFTAPVSQYLLSFKNNTSRCALPRRPP